MSPIRFLAVLTILSILIVFGLWLAAQNQWSIPSAWPSALIFHLLVNFSIYLWLYKTPIGPVFGFKYLSSLVLKFTLTLILMVIVGMVDPSGLVINTLFIFCTYLIYLILEVAVLYRIKNPQ